MISLEYTEIRIYPWNVGEEAFNASNLFLFFFVKLFKGASTHQCFHYFEITDGLF